MTIITVAQLRQPGDVYLGLEDIDDADYDPAEHLLGSEFGGTCDLPPNRYWWDRGRKTFRALEDELTRPQPPTAPSALNALAIALIKIWREWPDAAVAANRTPAEITEWLDFYVMSMDFPARTRRTREVVYYIEQRGLAPRGSPL